MSDITVNCHDFTGRSGDKRLCSASAHTRDLFENLYSPSKRGRTINSTNQDTNTNQIKTKTVTERTENT